MVNHISMSELNLQRFKNQLRNKISKGNVSKKEFSSLLMNLYSLKRNVVGKSSAPQLTDNDMELKTCEASMTPSQERQYNTLIDLIKTIRCELDIMTENENSIKNDVEVTKNGDTTDVYCEKKLIEGEGAKEQRNLQNVSGGIKIKGKKNDNIKDPIASTANQSDTFVSAEKIHVLLQQQKDNVSLQIDQEIQQQSEIESELVSLTGVLKNVTMDINRTVMEQNITLDEIQELVVENAEEVALQKKKISVRQEKSSNSLYTSIATIIWVFCWFVFTYLVMRLFPKPNY